MIEISQQDFFNSEPKPQNEQLDILKKHFPQCFDKNGAFLPEKLTEIVKSNDVPLNKEAYSLNWLGKSYAKLLRDLPPETLITEDCQHNQKPENQTSENLLIQGDNLEVLKHLKNAYSEQVKMIYIDPPYNTGSDGFVYQDDRKFSKEQLSELAGIDVDEAQRILAFTDKKSNSHSAWLTFMYPRLYIARSLLKDDGVIFISIDDNEVAQLRLFCDEVFGEENFIACFSWKRKKEVSSDSKNVSIQGEHILTYSKTFITQLKFEPLSESYINKSYKNPNEKFPLGKWRPVPITVSKGLSGGGYEYEIETPSGIKHNRLWAYPEESYKKLLANNLIYFGENNSGIPQKIIYAHDSKGQPTTNYWDNTSSNKEGKKEILSLFNNLRIFETPKPTKLLKRILQIATNKNDLILDFFAGSGTTADAVMQLNAEDNGNRKFILVQLPELIDPKKNKTAYDFVKNELGIEKPTIFEITKERIIRSHKKILQENNVETGHALSVQGFKIYKTCDNFCLKEDELSLNQEMFPKQAFSEQEYQTLLTSWRLYDGEKLTDQIITKNLQNYTAYLCGKNLYLLYPHFESQQIKALIEMLDKENDFSPNRIIFYGEHIQSSKQKELQQALESYANKKDLAISLLARY
ncbi:DNA methyltransferase [Pasteurella atlantica]|uniref:DNA methyltransferase n=1 Tax=Pasteurellaceae TaxID=712 RepID=UPI00276A53EC|nr:DNA methyltransferase [Pasteurella atlantica]MDP8033986.1 DNA methyltransferase [Pasteurella atlantica]MDP8035859.1 DNA methyltransferase [Pasteurella atlantica]MDP8037870.1 DNA methyltransferase [Pasteurella atlantica]MDP8048154.1 DNA methyltransferase [Pasteurella atlantica]MDP8050114.1 DNA methyltransferase [Pasteurella atlantica]